MSLGVEEDDDIGGGQGVPEAEPRMVRIAR